MKKKRDLPINNKEFKEWLYSFPQGKKRTKIRSKVMKECKVTYPITDNWIAGRSAIHPLIKEKIEEIAGKKIFTEE